MRVKDPERLMPSDANFTMRMSYGTIGGYTPKDGVYYKHYTTQKEYLKKKIQKSVSLGYNQKSFPSFAKAILVIMA